jgi:hypothetical protein
MGHGGKRGSSKAEQSRAVGLEDEQCRAAGEQGQGRDKGGGGGRGEQQGRAKQSSVTRG